MRIQCKQCGKEYRVKDEYLTEEGIRAKCRKCGAILRIRLRKKESSVEAEEENQPHAKPQVSETPPPAYRYCITCGHSLEREIASDERPLCSACEILEGVEKESPAFGPGGGRSHPGYLLYALLFVILLFSALLGYRLALS